MILEMAERHSTHQSLVLVYALMPAVLAPFVAETHVYGCVDAPLEVQDVGVRVIGTRQYHARVGGHLEIEFVENALAFVDFAELLVEVLCYV